MKTLVTFGSVVIAASTLLWFATRTDAPDTQPAQSGVIPKASPTQHEIAAVRRDPLRRPIPTIDTPGLSEPRLPSEAERAALLNEQRRRFQSQLEAEPADPSWASTASQQLRDDLERFPTTGVNVRGVDCRTTLCRVELAVADSGASAAFMEKWLRERKWTGGGFAVSDGESKLIVFVAKPGAQLAMVD